MDRKHWILVILLLSNQYIVIVRACSVLKLMTPEELVQQAYVIVRAKTIDYEKRPDNPNLWGTNIPPSPIIKFRVEEIIKGTNRIPDPLLISGYLNQYDDFNDHPVPYTFVRPYGRFGSCFANTYRQNASFLLFLNNEYTPYWAALAPVNEQLYSPPSDDKWLQWVKGQVVSGIYRQNNNQFVVSGASRPRLFFF